MKINSSRNSLVRVRSRISARRSRSSKIFSSLTSSASSTSKTSSTNKTTSTSSTSSTSTSTSTSSTTTSKQISLYEKVENSASEIQNITAKMEKLSEMTYTDDETGEESKENADKSLIKYVKSFVSEYNTVHSALGSLTGSSNTAYLKTLNNLAKSGTSSLNGIGITVSSTGELSYDEDKLEAVGSDKINEVFVNSNSFGQKISEKMETIESTSSTTLTTLNKLYGANSTYSKYGTSSSYGTSSNSSWYF